MSSSQIVRHPATWLVAMVVVGGTAFQIGRTNPGASGPVPTAPLLARPANYIPNAAPALEARTEGSVSSLGAMSDQFADLVEQVKPSVVHIRPVGADGTMRMGAGGSGSGAIFRPDGWIVTNAHVVGNADEVQVILANGREHKGRVITSDDSRNDIAVVKIDAQNLQAVNFADSSQVRVGQFAIAIGAPFELENTVTFGHVSALGRANLAGGGTASEVRSYVNMIQTDAPINPGNSGGPLLNIDGEIIGINTSIYSAGFMGGGQNAGIGFAIPSNQAKFISDLLINDGKLNRSFLNLSMETLKPYELEAKRLPGGVRVARVAPGGAAARAGLKNDDIVTKIGSFSIREDQDLLNALLRYPAGKRVDVQFIRDGKAKTVSATPDAAILADAQTPRREAPRQPNVPRFDAPDFFRDFPFELNPRQQPEQRDESEPRQEREVGQPARLGVTFDSLNAELRERFRIPDTQDGVVITDVEPGTVAARLGLRPGDVVQRIGNRSIRTGDDLVEAVRAAKVGDRSSIVFRRTAPGGFTTFSRTFEF